MKKSHLMIPAGLLSMTLMLGIGAAWAQQDQGSGQTGQKAGQKLDQAGQAIKKGFQDARDAIREQFAKAREAVNNMSVETRVYGRLHWDKALTSSMLELDVKSGVVTLHGTVPDAKAKLKAVELAADTVGITRVIDQLSIEPSTRTEPVATDVTPKR